MHKSIESTQLLNTLFISHLYVFKKETLLYLGLHFVIYLNISLYLFDSDAIGFTEDWLCRSSAYVQMAN